VDGDDVPRMVMTIVDDDADGGWTDDVGWNMMVDYGDRCG